MTEFLHFLGRFHVLVLHLPIGILLLAVLLESAGRTQRFRYLAPAVSAVWLLGAVAAIGTVVLGFLHAGEGGFDGAAVRPHAIAGTTLAVLATAIWLLRARVQGIYARTWPVLSIAVVALLFATGHFGGRLTHGEGYLMGALTQRAPRPAPTDVASADVYLDVVAPALQQRCSSCHNGSKRKGQLSLASYEELMKGGEHGPVIVAGDARGSELVRRITVPPDHKDFMPRDGKTPLSAEQTAAIEWWVSVGAPQSAAVSTLQPPSDVHASLASLLNLKPTVTQPAVADVPPPDVTVLDALERGGFVVRAVSVDSPLVQVDYTASRGITDADVAELAKIGDRVVSLNVRDAGLTDAQLQTVARFEKLTYLRVELNPITDVGVASLAPLKQLEVLNLHGTRVTDAALASLDSLEKLRELFVWGTRVTPAAVREFTRTHADVRVNVGFDPKTFPPAPKVIPVVN